MSTTSELYAPETKGENAYLQTLIDPWGAPQALIPDAAPTASRYARRLMTTKLLTGSSDYLFQLTPYNPRVQAVYYKPAAILDNCAGVPTVALQWPVNLRPLVAPGDWVWQGEMAPEELLSDNYSWARTQSMGFRVIADTQPIGVFSLSGMVHVMNAPQLFDFRSLESSELFKYRQDDNSLLASVRLTDGVVGLCEPIVTPMLPLGTNAVESAGNRLCLRYANARYFQTGGSGPIPTTVLTPFPNFSYDGTNSMVRLVPGSEFPFGMSGATTVTVNVAKALVSLAAQTYIVYYNNENDDGTPSAAVVGHIFNGYEAGTAGFALSYTTSFRYVSRSPLLGIFIGVTGLGDMSTAAGNMTITVENSEFLQLGFAEPFSLINVEKTDALMRVSFQATTNFEVIPEASVQSITRDMNSSRALIRYHMDDLKSAELPFAHKAAFGLSMAVPATNRDTYRNDAIFLSQRPVLRGYAAGIWSTLGDLIGSAWTAVKPGLKQWAIERIGKAAAIRADNGYACGRKGFAMKASGDFPRKLKGNAGRRRALPTLAIEPEPTGGSGDNETKPEGTMVLVPDKPEAIAMVYNTFDDVEDVGVVDGHRAFSVCKKKTDRKGFAMRRRALPPSRGEEKREALPPVEPEPQYMAYPADDDIRRQDVYRRACFLNGCPADPLMKEYGVFRFPYVVPGKEGNPTNVYEAEALVSSMMVQGVSYTQVVVDGKVVTVDSRIMSSDSASSILLSEENEIKDGLVLTLRDSSVTNVDVIDDDSYSLGLYACVAGYPTDQPFSGTLESADPLVPFGEVGMEQEKAAAMEALGKTLIIGVGTGTLPGRHSVLQNLRYREVANAVGLEYELTCLILINDSLVVKQGAYFASHGTPVTEKHSGAEQVAQNLANNTGNWEDAVMPALRAFGGNLADNFNNQYKRINELRKLSAREQLDMTRANMADSKKQALIKQNTNTKNGLASKYRSFVSGLQALKITLPESLQVPASELQYDTQLFDEIQQKIRSTNAEQHGIKTVEIKKDGDTVKAFYESGKGGWPPEIKRPLTKAEAALWGEVISRLALNKQGQSSQLWAEQLKRQKAEYPPQTVAQQVSPNLHLTKSQRSKPAWKRNPPQTVGASPFPRDGGSSGSGGSGGGATLPAPAFLL